MARNLEDEEFLRLREELAPMGEPPEMLPVEPSVDLGPPPEPPPALPPQLPIPKPPLEPTYGPGADQAALEAAIKDRSNSDIQSKFQDAASLFNKAFGGSAGDLAKATRDHRDDSFNDVMRRRALADQDAAAQKRQREAELDEALRDAGSDVSKSGRDLFFGTSVGKALRERLGDRADRLSASQIPGARDIIASETDLLKAGLKAGNGTDDGRSGALEALVEAAGGPDSDRGAFFAKAFAHAPLKVIKDQGFGLLSREEKQAFDRGMQTVRDTSAEKRARIMAGQKLEGELRKDRGELGSGLKTVGGFFPNAAIVESILAKHTGPNGEVKDLPAVGPLAKPLTDFGGGFFRSKEGTELAKAGDQIQLAFRNLITGSAASTEEDRRINLAGLDRRNLQSFVTGFQAMKKQYTDLLERTYGLYEPPVAQGFIARAPQYGIPGHPVYDPAVAKRAFAQYEANSQTRQLMPGIEKLAKETGAAAPKLNTSTSVTTPRIRLNGKVYEEGPDGEAVEVEEE